jgi:hypothetical protein
MHKLASNKNLHKMFRDAKELVEKFIGPGKVDTIVEDFNNLFEIVRPQPHRGRRGVRRVLIRV